MTNVHYLVKKVLGSVIYIYSKIYHKLSAISPRIAQLGRG